MATLDRNYQWVSDPATTLPFGVPAALRVQMCGHATYYHVSDSQDGTYTITEELPGGRMAHSVKVDSTFGPKVEHWECSCGHFRHRNRRGVSHGCLHVSALYAALACVER